MKRSITLLVPALAIAIAACSTSSSPSAVPTAASTPSPAATTAAAPSSMPPASAAAMTKDIVQTATEAGSFTTLLTAVKAAGLVETLQGEGPFTVFAPTDAAFAALPAGTLDGLLKDPAALKKILLYHVVSGSVASDKVVGLTSATSVEGSPVTKLMFLTTFPASAGCGAMPDGKESATRGASKRYGSEISSGG